MPYIQLQFRRDSSLNWIQTNPILASGEMGIELDTHTFKIGDGVLRWNDLPYGGLQGPPGPAGGTPVAPGIPGQVLTFTGPASGDVVWANPPYGSGKSALIKAAFSLTNFDFLNATRNISQTFGTGYTPGIYVNNVISGSVTDTTGFAINIAPNYNMLNLPIIIGTIAYWDGQKVNYMQIKFGNSSTSNAVRASIVPINIPGINPSTNLPTYGAPLQLRVEGISSAAFSGVSNISSTAPLNYAIVIYLELAN
jgi:hypothetical protein